MQQLFTYFFRLCLLRADPAHAPNSTGFLLAILALNTLVSVVAYVSSPALPINAMLPALALGLMLEAGATGGLLWYRDVFTRFVPTMSALLATSTIINGLFLPLAIGAEQMMASDPAGAGKQLMEFFTWFSFLWWVAVTGFILQRAANLPFGIAAAFALTLQISYILALSSLNAGSA